GGRHPSSPTHRPDQPKPARPPSAVRERLATVARHASNLQRITRTADLAHRASEHARVAYAFPTRLTGPAAYAWSSFGHGNLAAAPAAATPDLARSRRRAPICPRSNPGFARPRATPGIVASDAPPALCLRLPLAEAPAPAGPPRPGHAGA